MKFKSMAALCLVAFSLFFSKSLRADEGMWLPLLLKNYNYDEMKRLGCKLTPEQIYDINTSSVKDAIVQLGGFCTAELVSAEGLLFTNHHCAYDAIQSISSVQNDYLTDGFWALKRSEERPIDGLTVSFLVRVEDVTAKVNQAGDDAEDSDKEFAMSKKQSEIEEAASEEGKYRTEVKTMFDGNAHYLFVYEVFRDIRLVGAPPSSIGKFGGDTDNWMWPRHTGDFSILRIYADKNNSPADYSKDNVPYKSKHFLPISIKGQKEGDFNMVMGYPGSTDRYLTSYEVEQSLKTTNPAYVKILGERLKIMKSHMDASDEVRIKLASNYASLSNTYKYFKGQIKSLNHNKLVQTLRKEEDLYQNWADKPENRDEFGFVLSGIKTAVDDANEVQKLNAYANMAGFGPELVTRGIQLYRLHMTMARDPKNSDAWSPTVDRILAGIDEMFTDYDAATDKDILSATSAMIINDISSESLPDFYSSKMYQKAKGNTVNDKCVSMAETIFKKSILADKEKLRAFLQKPKFKKLDKDPGVQYVLSIISWYRSQIAVPNGTFQSKLGEKRKAYIKGLMKMHVGKKFYPDANFTMRLTYGTIKGYSSWEGKPYSTFTYASEILEKEDPSSDEFIVPTKLKNLIEQKNFGQYGENGKLSVCFINNTDITGGNSGSPVIDANGHLVGIAFDGNWESMGSDLVFEDEFVRTISVDSRYVLFIIDKYANAGHLLDEMKIIK